MRFCKDTVKGYCFDQEELQAIYSSLIALREKKNKHETEKEHLLTVTKLIKQFNDEIFDQL